MRGIIGYDSPQYIKRIVGVKYHGCVECTFCGRKHRNTFNSLCEIHRQYESVSQQTRIKLSILFVRFLRLSLKSTQPTPRLSILFVRFMEFDVKASSITVIMLSILFVRF